MVRVVFFVLFFSTGDVGCAQQWELELWSLRLLCLCVFWPGKDPCHCTGCTAVQADWRDWSVIATQISSMRFR